MASNKPPPVLDAATDTALLAALTVPIMAATVMTWSFWPLLLGLGPAAIAVWRRRFLAVLLIAALLCVAALPVAYRHLDVH